MLIDTPHHRYFRTKEGRWTGSFVLKITDLPQLRAMQWFERWSIRFMAFSARYLSAPTLSTSIDYSTRGAQNEVVHTTRMSNWGFTVFCSVETITLEADGRSFRMAGKQSCFPFLWKSSAWGARGSVAIDFDGAAYQIPWFGLMIKQNTRMTKEGLEVIQKTPFSEAVVLLRRKGPLIT